jgi:hypothetical protein
MKANKQQLKPLIVRTCSLFIVLALFVRCQGPMGPKGNDGLDGLDGINYTHSIIYDVDPSEWSGSADGYFVSLNVPEITDNIYYDGAVLVYRLVEIDPKSFNLLPYTYVENDLAIYMDFDAYVGSIDLTYKEVFQGVNDTPAPANLMSFKIVIIEGIPLATLKTQVNINDFAAVSKLLNLDNARGKNQ